MKLAEIAVRSDRMGASPVLFHAIHIDMPVQAVYRRLGYRTGTTRLTAGQLREIETGIDDAAALVELKGSAMIIPVEEHRQGEVLLASGDILRSSRLSSLLEGSSEVLLMGATAGSRIMEEITRETAEGNLSRAVVLDAVASEMADKALDWISGYMGRELARRLKVLSPRRFSAGYGDFALENQQIMYERLRLIEIGVGITGSFVLVPEKSVTALAGIMMGEA